MRIGFIRLRIGTSGAVVAENFRFLLKGRAAEQLLNFQTGMSFVELFISIINTYRIRTISYPIRFYSLHASISAYHFSKVNSCLLVDLIRGYILFPDTITF